MLRFLRLRSWTCMCMCDEACFTGLTTHGRCLRFGTPDESMHQLALEECGRHNAPNAWCLSASKEVWEGLLGHAQ